MPPRTFTPAPDAVYEDDLYLISFPKSGNTWARFLFANLLKSDAGEVIDFHTAVRYVPEVDTHNEAIDALARPRILKSHATVSAVYPRVIYLVRDPRDAYISYYHYRQGRLPEGMRFSAFLRSQHVWPCRWHEHVGPWIDRERVLVVRYEDMLADTACELRRMVNFWSQRSFNDAQINAAVEASRFEQMKRLEQTNGRPFMNELAARQARPFMRKGGTGDWREHFTAADAQLVRREAGGLMQRLGYDWS
jgi:hypothetical protein